MSRVSDYIVCGWGVGQRATACGWICHGSQSKHMISKSTVLSVRNKLDTRIVSSVKNKARIQNFKFIHVSLTRIFLASWIGGGLTR